VTVPCAGGAVVAGFGGSGGSDGRSDDDSGIDEELRQEVCVC
jgi:hypothetical protein